MQGANLPCEEQPRKDQINRLLNSLCSQSTDGAVISGSARSMAVIKYLGVTAHTEKAHKRQVAAQACIYKVRLSSV